MAEPTRKEWPEGRQMAAELIRRHPDVFKGVPPLSDILFVYDRESSPKSKGNYIGARVSKIPTKFDDFLNAGDKLWMLEWFHWNTERMTRNQRLVLMAHELLHFEHNEKTGEYGLVGHDVEEFWLIADRFGLHWNEETHGDVPDILSPDFEWGKVGQARLRFDGPDSTRKSPEELQRLAADLIDKFGPAGARMIVTAIQHDNTARSLIGQVAENLEQIAQDMAHIAPGHEVTITAGDKSATAKVDDPTWQPSEPYVKSTNVVEFPHRPTGTSEGS